MAGAVGVAARELRLLFGLLLILFVTSEVWRYAGRLDWTRLVAVLATALLAVAALLGVGLRHTLASSVHPTVVTRAVFRVAQEVAVFGVTLFAALVVLGFVTIDHPLTQEWTGDESARVLFDVRLLGQQLVLTLPLVQVAACLAAVGILVFAIEVIVDSGARAALLDDLIDH